MCGLVASPEALKPSVGDGTESSFQSPHLSFLCYLHFFLSLSNYLHLFSDVYANNNNNKNNKNSPGTQAFTLSVIARSRAESTCVWANSARNGEGLGKCR